MSGTKIGGVKAAATNKRLYGSDFYRTAGRAGGVAPHTKPRGFAAMTVEQRIAASRKGGQSGKRVVTD